MTAVFLIIFEENIKIRAQPRGRFGRKCLPNLAPFSLFGAE